MEESPRKQQSTSRVIDSLHSQIDSLKDELENLKSSHNDYKKKNSILKTRNDSLVDQLANYKHENDMVNALLKRKERRIVDLEAEFDELSSVSESLKVSVKNYKIRCENLQESSASSMSESERLKISYEALVASQNEYKRHYQEELQKLAAQLEAVKAESLRNMSDLVAKFERNDKDVDALLEGLKSKRTTIDNMLVNRNTSFLSLLSLVAKVAKTHGEECKSILHDNVEIINTLRETLPEALSSIPERTEATIDLDALLKTSAVCLDTSFNDFEEHSRQPSRASSVSSRKPNRNFWRVSSNSSDDSSFVSLPKQRNSSRGYDAKFQANDRQFSKKQGSPSAQSYKYNYKRNTSNGKQNSNPNQQHPLHHSWKNNDGSHDKGHQTSDWWNPTNRHASYNNSNKSYKRRSFYGGSNNFNIASSERKISGRAEELS